MMYADTDFFLALLKHKDWLRDKAVRLYNLHKGKISTSVVTVIELLLLAKRYNLDAERLIASVYELGIDVLGIEKNSALAAAHYVKEKGFNVFDAMHAVFCGVSEIISSDAVYERIGLSRVKLEKDQA